MNHPLVKGNHTRYSEQSHRDLCLAVFDSAPCLEDFTTFKESRFVCSRSSLKDGAPISVILRIIGESHVLSANRGDISFAEVLSCASLYKPSPVHIWRIDGAGTEMESSCRLRAGFYKSSLLCLPLDEEKADKWFCEIEDYRSVIKHIFPSRNGAAGPFTRVGASMTKGMSLVYRSIHSYPNERMMVLSESELNFNS